MAYLPIENYGLIGNMRTAALVGINGSIDWFCFPHFDSPSVFGALLDDQKGGSFAITSTHEGAQSKQLYWPDTNVLVTRFLCPDGVREVQDFMPVGKAIQHEASNQLVRRVRVSRGVMQFRVICRPAFDYARETHRLDLTNEGAVCPGHPMEKSAHDVQTLAICSAERSTTLFSSTVLSTPRAGTDRPPVALPHLCPLRMSVRRLDETAYLARAPGFASTSTSPIIPARS